MRLAWWAAAVVTAAAAVPVASSGSEPVRAHSAQAECADLAPVTDFNTFAPGNDWAPTDHVKSTGGMNVLVPLVGSTSARVQITPLGSDSNWRIDDFYVDPWASACC